MGTQETLYRQQVLQCEGGDRTSWNITSIRNLWPPLGTGSKFSVVKAVTEHWQTQLQLENARTSIMYRQQMDLDSARVNSHGWTSYRQPLRADPRENYEEHKCK